MNTPLEHFPPGSEQYISHPAHARSGIHPYPDKLYVVTMVENPLRWRSRYWNYWTFAEQFVSSITELWTVEVAFGGRAFEITSAGNPRHLQLRTSSEIWHKENALNLLIERLPAEANYIACIDADLKFVRPDFAQETLQLLQHYDLIQMFSHLVDVDSEYQPVNSGAAVGLAYLRATHPELRPGSRVPTNDDYSGIGSWGCPGGAWAYRKTALNTIGGLLDWLITGAADFWMAKALYGEMTDVLQGQSFGAALQNFALAWQDGAVRLKQNIGHLPGTVNHYYHGPKAKRGYDRRRPLLQQFNPLTDIRRDVQGLYELVGDNLALRDGLRAIARSRDEDAR